MHLIGVGGVGMSALARILARRGKRVTGTDRADSSRLRTLQAEGVDARVGHEPRAVHGADCVVVTTALPEDNVELLEAQRLGLPVLHRAEVLAAIVRERPAIAVTGTHGKSTTTALLGHVLAAAGLDPLVVVGADVQEWGGNVRHGEGPWTVFEACESDGTLLLYTGCCQVVTSLEPDHLDQHGSFEALVATMRRFVLSAATDGFVVFNADSQAAASVAQGGPARAVGYGRECGEYRARAIELEGLDGVRFRVSGPSGEVALRLPLLGEHSALNATAALAAAAQVGVATDVVASALADAPRLARRFEILGAVGTSVVVDDYAHHPTEVRATIQAAKAHLGRPVLAIFQPHLYSRTRDLFDEFARAFDEADHVIITKIYPAREEPIAGVTAAKLAEAVAQRRGGRPTRFVPDMADIVAAVRSDYADGWTILVLGAGDIRKVAEELTGED